MRVPLPWRLPAEEFLLLGPVSRDGFRSVDTPREPARHRSMPAVDERQALPLTDFLSRKELGNDAETDVVGNAAPGG